MASELRLSAHYFPPPNSQVIYAGQCHFTKLPQAPECPYPQQVRISLWSISLSELLQKYLINKGFACKKASTIAYRYINWPRK